MSVDDLLFAPISATKGFLMDVKEYKAKLDTMEVTATEIDAVVRRLAHAAKELAEWQETTSPVMAGGPVRTLHAAAWKSLDEVNKLIEQYWAQREDVKRAWDALPEEIQNLRPPPKSP
jgi:exopolyphosphatase/pppGpp-phosphohydrolase